ncbi:hypothetical protein BpHYR1_049167 [Brachionus plicatilis]|uniref:Uncharacterized protein n=1 Tax=Brachionus plicatilis TaxID=10195 RepID=A0A3M7QUZ5_BRAPC|nr:hypothetical protein BpHYR1_049167 [Brachionus plicatilis]
MSLAFILNPIIKNNEIVKSHLEDDDQFKISFLFKDLFFKSTLHINSLNRNDILIINIKMSARNEKMKKTLNCKK